MSEFRPRGYRSQDRAREKHMITPEKMEHHAEILSNRIRNRFRHFSRKYRKKNIDCYRLYDWDIPEVRAVVDWYKGHAVIGEYVRWQTGSDWLARMARAVSETLEIPLEHVHLKQRQTDPGEGERYTRLGKKNERFEVMERDLKFWVNLDDFLDTGLYSDHRETRQIIRDLAQGHDFLNLYAYTGAFTCAAASGGAKSTTTVDRNRTYLKWAKDNLKLNDLDGDQHKIVQLDTDEFLARAYDQGVKFTLCFVDPPSFFKDHTKNTSFDINEDHPQMLFSIIRIMKPGALIFFSTNHQRFKPKFEGLNVADIKELTPKTIPEDYRNQQIHRCWRMVAG